MALSFVSDWTILGERFVRSQQLHSRADGSPLFPLTKSSLIASCMYGGPIAIANSLSKNGESWRISILTSNGSRLGEISTNSVIAIFWSRCQKLLVVGAAGRTLVYDSTGSTLLNSFSMGEENHEFGIAEATIFTTYSHQQGASVLETGLAVVNRARQVYAVSSVNSPVLWRLSLPTPQSLPSSCALLPSCWAVLGTSRAEVVKPPTALFCYGDGAHFYAGSLGDERVQPCPSFEWALTSGSYIAMVPSIHMAKEGAAGQPSMLLLVHDSGLIQVVRSGDLHSLLYTIEMGAALSPDSSSSSKFTPFWCGNNPVMIATMKETAPGSINFHSPPNHSCTINLPSPPLARASHPVVVLTAEVDGIRAFTPHASYFLTPVREASQNVLGLTSTEPGASLFEASLKLERRDHTFYDYVKMIGADKIELAVEQCLDASMDQLDTEVQKSLLLAAQMGRALQSGRGSGRDGGNRERFHTLARELRIANNLRKECGLGITNRELHLLTIPVVVDRLISLRQWLPATAICNLMELPIESGVHKVLAHWCLGIMKAYKQQQQQKQPFDDGNGSDRPPMSEEGLAVKILRRLEAYPGVSYADVADVAAKQELKKLAALLLDKEPNASRQVMVLLKLREVDRALAKAVQSQQPDLLHLVLRHMRKSTESTAEMELRLRRWPQALALYQSYVREEAPDKALALYEQGDDFTRQAIYHLSKAREQFEQAFPDAGKAATSLAKAESSMQAMKDTNAAHLISASRQLLTDNARREEGHLTSLVDKSLRETFIWAVAGGDDTLAEELHKQHRLNDRQLWCWRVEGFAQGGRWAEVERLGRGTKRPPAEGYSMLVEACARHGNKELAASILEKITAYEEQIRAYLAVGDITKAIKLAASKQDVQQLQQIRRRFLPSSEQYEEVVMAIRALQQR